MTIRSRLHPQSGEWGQGKRERESKGGIGRERDKGGANGSKIKTNCQGNGRHAHMGGGSSREWWWRKRFARRMCSRRGKTERQGEARNGETEVTTRRGFGATVVVGTAYRLLRAEQSERGEINYGEEEMSLRYGSLPEAAGRRDFAAGQVSRSRDPAHVQDRGQPVAQAARHSRQGRWQHHLRNRRAHSQLVYAVVGTLPASLRGSEWQLRLTQTKATPGVKSVP